MVSSAGRIIRGSAVTSPDQAHEILLARLSERGVRGRAAKALLRKLRHLPPVHGAQALQRYGLGYREAFDALQVLHIAEDGPHDDTDPNTGLPASVLFVLGLGCLALGFVLTKFSHDAATAQGTAHYYLFHGCFLSGALLLLRAAIKWVRS